MTSKGTRGAAGGCLDASGSEFSVGEVTGVLRALSASSWFWTVTSVGEPYILHRWSPMVQTT